MENTPQSNISKETNQVWLQALVSKQPSRLSGSAWTIFWEKPNTTSTWIWLIRMNQNITFYKISVQAKKWWRPLFTVMADAAIQKAWLLYKKSDASKSRLRDILGFRRKVVNIYHRKYSSWQRGVGSVGRSIPVASRKPVKVPEQVCCDEQRHYPASNLIQRKTASCGMKVKFIREKCNVGLHTDYFAAYHNW